MTTPIYLQPDIVKMVVGFLRAQAEVTALIPAAQIRGELGPNPTFPAARVTRITDTPAVTSPPVLEEVTVQIDVWGGNNRQAERIAATVKAALLWRGPNYANDEGVITKTESRGMSDVTDEDFDPPRERYIVTIDLWTRPEYDLPT